MLNMGLGFHLDSVAEDTWYLSHRAWRESMLVLTGKLHFYWLGFVVLEGVTHMARGEKESQILHSCQPCELQ